MYTSERKLFLFNIWYEQFSDKDYTQLTMLILIAKDRALKISKEDCILKWNNYNCFSQSLFTVELTRKVLRNTYCTESLIAKFSKYLLDNKDRLI